RMNNDANGSLRALKKLFYEKRYEDCMSLDIEKNCRVVDKVDFLSVQARALTKMNSHVEAMDFYAKCIKTSQPSLEFDYSFFKDMRASFNKSFMTSQEESNFWGRCTISLETYFSNSFDLALAGDYETAKKNLDRFFEAVKFGKFVEAN